MRPELFTIPFLDMPIKSYGFMMMVGFLTAVWLGMKRAERVKASPDLILNCGMICLLFGVGGARLFYVIHYWKTSFAYQPHPLWAAFDITAGGLEYLGGVIGAVLGVAVYLSLYGRAFARKMPRPSVRLYMDLLAPISIWGLAMTRVGCYLNGCCWGGVCTHETGARALPWAVQFPFNSPAHERQWMDRLVRVPAELITDEPRFGTTATLVPRSLLEGSPEKYQRPLREFEEIEAQYEAEKSKGIPGEALAAMARRREELKKESEKAQASVAPLMAATQFPSRKDPARAITVSELRDLGMGLNSLPVHPTQLYDTINAVLLSWLLTMIFYHRKRHGVVLGWMMLLYPISRLLLESIRVDNPHDAGGLTISQAFSLGMFAIGVLYMIWMYRLPLRSPLAVPWVDPCVTRDAEVVTARRPAPA